MARPSTRSTYLATLRSLRKHAAPVYPVSVRRGDPGEGCLASCCLEKRGRSRRFLILIRPEAKLQESVASLIHEWAHCLAWSEGHPNVTDHDEHFGVAYSRAYRAVFPDAPSAIRE